MKREGDRVIFSNRERRLSGYESVLLGNVPVVVAELESRSQVIMSGSIAGSVDREIEQDLRRIKAEIADAEPVDPQAEFQQGVDLGMLARKLEGFRLPGGVINLPTPTDAQMNAFLRNLDEAS